MYKVVAYHIAACNTQSYNKGSKSKQVSKLYIVLHICMPIMDHVKI